MSIRDKLSKISSIGHDTSRRNRKSISALPASSAARLGIRQRAGSSAQRALSAGSGKYRPALGWGQTLPPGDKISRASLRLGSSPRSARQGSGLTPTCSSSNLAARHLELWHGWPTVPGGGWPSAERCGCCSLVGSRKRPRTRSLATRPRTMTPSRASLRLTPP
jgi:hypothetical protein